MDCKHFQTLELIDKSPFLKHKDKDPRKVRKNSSVDCLYQGTHTTSSQKHARWLRGIADEMPKMRSGTITQFQFENENAFNNQQLPQVVHSMPSSPGSSASHRNLSWLGQDMNSSSVEIALSPIYVKQNLHGNQRPATCTGRSSQSSSPAPWRSTGKDVEVQDSFDTHGPRLRSATPGRLHEPNLREAALTQIHFKTNPGRNHSVSAEAHRLPVYPHKEPPRKSCLFERPRSMTDDPPSPKRLGIKVNGVSEHSKFHQHLSATNKGEGGKHTPPPTFITEQCPPEASNQSEFNTVRFLYFPGDDSQYRPKKWHAIVMVAFSLRLLATGAKHRRKKIAQHKPSNVTNSTRVDNPPKATKFLSMANSNVSTWTTSLSLEPDLEPFASSSSSINFLQPSGNFSSFLDDSPRDHITGPDLPASLTHPKIRDLTGKEKSLRHLVKIVQACSIHPGSMNAGSRHDVVQANKLTLEMMQAATRQESFENKNSILRLTHLEKEAKRRIKSWLGILALAARSSIFLRYQFNPIMRVLVKKSTLFKIKTQMKMASTAYYLFSHSHFENQNPYSKTRKLSAAAAVLPDHLKNLFLSYIKTFRKRCWQKHADIVTDFFRRVSFCRNMRMLVGRMMKRVQLIQRMGKGFFICKQARLAMLSELWRKMEPGIMKKVHADYKRFQDDQKRKQLAAVTDYQKDKWLPEKALAYEGLRRNFAKEVHKGQRIMDEMASRDRAFEREQEFEKEPKNSLARRMRDEKRRVAKRLHRQAVDYGISSEKLKMIHEFLRSERKNFLEKLSVLKLEHDRSKPKPMRSEGAAIEFLENFLKGPTLEQLGLNLPNRPLLMVVSGSPKARFEKLIRASCDKQFEQQRELRMKEMLDDCESGGKGARINGSISYPGKSSRTIAFPF